MKVAFVGKGGSGKTTLSSLFIRYLAAQQLPVLAFDADINQHLGVALGMSEQQAASIPALGAHLTRIKEHLRGDNERISSVASMVKTTPPGAGSRLLTMAEDNPIHAACERRVNGVRLMVTGPFNESDLGVACYHSKVGAVELYLNHLVDFVGEYVVVDMTAGSDSFASGLFTRFDVTFLVAEPTRKGVSVYRQYKQYAEDYDVRLCVLGNKVQGPDDEAFLRAEVGDDLLYCFAQSDFVRALEKGRSPAFDTLEPANLAGLGRALATVDAAEKDWPKFTRQTVEFHLKNAHSWANRAVGEDLSSQVDPDFELGPQALRAAASASPAAATAQR